MTPRSASVGQSRPAVLATAKEIIAEARDGRMFILVDDFEPDQTGDLAIPAQAAAADAINFMAAHGRGLIRLALTEQRVIQLGLPPMSREESNPRRGAFTVSIEARTGVTTGISTADRARTISVAIGSDNPHEDIATPGHVFPIAAVEGGVLVNAGHAEAAVDVARLAGLNPSGVICEIMRDDGEVARFDDLVAFASRHSLKIGTVRDLIAYRQRYDRLVERRAEFTFESRWGGTWKVITYLNRTNGSEQIALVKGEIDPSKPTMVRMHTLSYFADIFGEQTERTGLLPRAMEMIAEAGSGAIVVLNRAMRDWMTTVIGLRKAGAQRGEPAIEALQDYGIGAQILAELGVKDIILLTNSHYQLVGLAEYGLSVVSERRVEV